MIKKLNGDLCHEILASNAQRKLAFNPKSNYDLWKRDVRLKFEELFGICRIRENICPLNIDVEEITERDGFKQIRFTFESEIGSVIPCYLLVPNGKINKYPVAIELLGHVSGFHNCIGVAKYDDDIEKYFPRYNMGIQAVRNGFAALCIEQRGMGENGSPRTYGEDVIFKPCRQTCAFISLTAINLGRTVLGERIWDVSRAIDALGEFEKYGIDLNKIIITGQSGGGTASYYAACYDERIKYSAPSCGFCTYQDSIMDIEHCACNYVPGICDWFEMADIAGLMAPRKLTIYAGKLDDIFPIEGVRKAFETIKEIYASVGMPDNCRLVETPKNHYWCDELVWENILADTERI